ncbi:MAG: hypothetical protein ACLPY1_13750 [Terracidiphilus sp.]
MNILIFYTAQLARPTVCSSSGCVVGYSEVMLGLDADATADPSTSVAAATDVEG